MRKPKIRFYFLMLTAVICGSACEGQEPVKEAPTAATAAVTARDQFSAYWYAGEAELNRYTLEQMRYGEKRRGEAVLIFVTENFLPERQVKDESGSTESVTVLKLNAMKKFETGIYDYSVMQSVFTPIDARKMPYTLKATFSSQDWCGQAFSQINLRGKTLHHQVRSYFENPGDAEHTLDATYFEDDIWNRLRLQPQTVPLGEVEIIPSQEHLRLRHEDFLPQKAKGTLSLLITDDKTGKEYYIYTLEYKDAGRTVTWKCESKFPFKITEWREEIFSESGRKETTTGKLTHTLNNSYWKLNSKSDTSLRDSLGIQLHFAE